MEICTILIDFMISKKHSNLHLQISREYFALQKKSVSLGSFASTKRLEIIDLMRSSFLQKSYVPCTDLLRFTSPEIIREMIFDEPPQNVKSSEIEDFIESVVLNARKLFAQCIFAGLTMGCLHTLLAKGLSDKNFPLEATHCCHKKCRANFRNIIKDQGGFRAAEFNKAGLHQKIHSKVVVPIEFHFKDNYLKEEIANYSEDESTKIGFKVESSKKNARCGSGAYSNVYRVKVNHDHHRLQNSGDVFAMKEFRKCSLRGGLDFQKELKILNELWKFPHNHIVIHLTT